MTKNEYQQYLRAPHWQYVSERAKKEANYKCSLCCGAEHISVHHNNYDCLHKETNVDIIVLCNRCHMKFHAILPKWKRTSIKAIAPLVPAKKSADRKSPVKNDMMADAQIDISKFTLETREPGNNTQNHYINVVHRNGIWTAHNARNYGKLSVPKDERVDGGPAWQSAYSIMSRCDPHHLDLSILKKLKRLPSEEVQQLVGAVYPDFRVEIGSEEEL